MNATITRQYLKARAPHFQQFGNGTTRTFQATAQSVLREVRVRAEWDEWFADSTPLVGEDIGAVRLRIVPDDCVSFDDLEGDTFNPRVNSDIPASRLKREQKEFREKVEREGVCGVIGEFWNGSEWERADSCFGFVGDDWKDSGYDVDIMRSTLDAARAYRDIAENRAPYPETWKQPIGHLIPAERGHKVTGLCCLLEENAFMDLRKTHKYAPIFYANIGPLYSQHCAVCGRELIHGTSGVELFDDK